jgi:hypothetical protein
MLAFTVGQYVRVRVWLDDLPQAAYPSTDVVTRVIKSANIGNTETRQVAMELFRPTCGPSSYGLLGGRFKPMRTGTLEVHVAFTEGPTDHFAGALAPSDDVRVGLPFGYVLGVLNGALGSKEIHNIGAGTIMFDCAAHGYVGSSLSIFRMLAEEVVGLLSATNTETAIEVLKDNLTARFL